MKKVQIMFEVENLDFHVPRLCIKSSLFADVKDWTKQVQIYALKACCMLIFFVEKLSNFTTLL